MAYSQNPTNQNVPNYNMQNLHRIQNMMSNPN